MLPDDPRTVVRERVTAVSPADEKEAADQAAILSWIDSGAPLFRIAKPATPKMKPRITSSSKPPPHVARSMKRNVQVSRLSRVVLQSVATRTGEKDRKRAVGSDRNPASATSAIRT